MIVISTVKSPISIMELNNQQLTAELVALKEKLFTMETVLNTAVSKLDTSVQETRDFANGIDTQLKTHLNPILDAKVVESLTQINTDYKALEVSMDTRLAVVSAEIKNARDILSDDVGNYKLINDRIVAQITEINRKADETQQHLVKVIEDARGEKNANEQKYLSQQNQMATLHSVASSSSGSHGGGGKKPGEPIVCHKLMLNKNTLSGEEDYDSFDEWYIDMADDFEILMPGSKQILREAEQSKDRILIDEIMLRGNATLVTTVSRELFSVLKKKTVGQARAQLKALNENEGLEAWRLIRANLCRKDGQRLQGEFDTLTSLQQIKLAGFRDFPILHQRWESELTKFSAVDSEYKLGKFQKRNIIYRALPQDIKEDVDREQAKNQELANYDELIRFVINLSRSQKYQKTSVPKPLTANLVEEQTEPQEIAAAKPQEPVYTVEEWILFLRSDEGQKHIAEGNALPQEGQSALNSVVKGGGKGNNWSKGGGKDPRGKGGWNGGKGSWNSGKGGGWNSGKGKGKGTDGKGKDGKGRNMENIQCHGCQKWGHYVRDCPDRAVKALEEADWGMPYDPNYVTLVVTDSCFTGYGKSNWINAETIQKPVGDSNQVHDIPKTDEGWIRPKKSRGKSNQSQVLMTLPNCSGGCDCEQGNPWMEISENSSNVIETSFPPVHEALNASIKSTKSPMPKFPRKKPQSSDKRNKRSKITCDADNMKIGALNKILLAKQTIDHVESVQLDVEEQTAHVEKVDVSVEQVETHHQSIPVTVDDRPPPVHWKVALDESILNEEQRRNASRLPGCGPECEFGRHSLKSCKADLSKAKHEFDRTTDASIGSDEVVPIEHDDQNAQDLHERQITEKPDTSQIDWSAILTETVAREQVRERLKLDSDDGHGSKSVRKVVEEMSKPAFHHTSHHIAPTSSINLLTPGDGMRSVMPVETGMVWAQVPCAVDSGACAHVSPPDIFGASNKDNVVKAKYFGADGSPIDEFGKLTVNAVMEGGMAMSTSFDIVNITRPLLSVNQMVANGHNVVFGRNVSYIQIAGSNQRINLRAEGKLYMLDLWVKIPAETARSSPFVRQVSPA